MNVLLFMRRNRSCSSILWLSKGLSIRHQSNSQLGCDLLSLSDEVPQSKYDKQYGLKGIEKKSKYRGKFRKPPLPNGEIVFGIHPVLLAIQAQRRTLNTIYMKNTLVTSNSSKSIIGDLIKSAEDSKINIQSVQKHVLDFYSCNRPHQGVCLDASKLKYENLQSLEKNSDTNNTNNPTGRSLKVNIVLDKVKDPMNLGAIIRTSYYLGVESLIVGKHDSCPLSPVVSKASSGAMEVMPVYSVEDIGSFLLERQNHWDIFGTIGSRSFISTDARCIPIEKVNLNRDTLLVIGNEGEGLNAEVLHLCDKLITIPSCNQIHPGIDSLNVSVATGIILNKLQRVTE